MKKEQKPRSPMKLEEVKRTARRNALHLNSSEINGRLIVLTCERAELERQELDLSFALQVARSKRAEVQAVIHGLNAVLDGRQA